MPEKCGVVSVNITAGCRAPRQSLMQLCGPAQLGAEGGVSADQMEGAVSTGTGPSAGKRHTAGAKRAVRDRHRPSSKLNAQGMPFLHLFAAKLQPWMEKEVILQAGGPFPFSTS